MNKRLWAKAKQLASKNYSVEVSQDRDSNNHIIYLAKNPELYGCMAQGETIDEAFESLAEARVDYIYSLLQDEQEVPDIGITKTTDQPVVNILTTDNFAIQQIKDDSIIQTRKDNQSEQRELLFEATLKTQF